MSGMSDSATTSAVPSPNTIPPASEAGDGLFDTGSERDEIEDFTPLQQEPKKRKAPDGGDETMERGTGGAGASEAEGLRAVMGPVSVIPNFSFAPANETW